MAAEALDSSLHRGIHLFTHPTLIYSVINGRQPRFLRRNLSYSGNAALGANLRRSRAAGSALRVRLGDVHMEGANLPGQITLMAVLCEAATTARDFKPLRAAAVTLLAREAKTAQPAAMTATLRDARIGGEQPPETLLLPLPKRKLTRPVLLLLASDRHPDLTALVAPGSKKARHLKTDLRSGGPLLGLLPELSSVWAAIQQLDAELLSGGGGSGSGSSGDGSSSDGVSRNPDAGAVSRRSVARVTLRRGRIARSRCSVVAASGAALVAALLNLEMGPEQHRFGEADGDGRAGQRPPSGEERQQGEEQQQKERQGDGQQQQRQQRKHQQQQRDQQQQQAGTEPDRPRMGRPRSRELAALGGTVAAAATQMDGRATRMSGAGGGGRLTRSCIGAATAASAAGGDEGLASAAAVDDVQVVRLSALAVSLELDVRPATAEGPLPTTLPAAAGGAQCTAPDDEETVVEFRYVYDDASWSRCSTGAAAGSRSQRQQKQQLLRAEQQLLQLQQQQLELQERRSGDAAGDCRSKALAEGAAAAAAAGGDSSSGAHVGGADRTAWMKQQMKKTTAATTVGGGAVAAPAMERYFAEELRVPAGAPFGCPLCAVTCRGFQGLQQHLPASHGLYRYAFPEEEAADDVAVATGGRNGGICAAAAAGAQAPRDQDGDGGGSDSGRRSALQRAPRRFIVEVRLPADTVDTARRDLVLPQEDVLVLTQDGLPVSVALRCWVFSRAQTMSGPVYTDTSAVANAAAAGTADTAAGASSPSQAQPAALPSSPLPQGRLGGRDRGGGRVGGRAGPSDDEARAGSAAGQRHSRAQQQQQQQPQLPQPPPQQPSTAGGSSGGRGSGTTTLVQVPLESLRMSAAGTMEVQPEDGAAAVAVAAPSANGAPGGPVAAGTAVPPSVLAVGVHPPGRRYFHCRSFIPGSAEEMFGPYDSDDETDDEEWEASFDRHMAQNMAFTPLRAADRRFFKLWSAFARRRPIYSDFITRIRCLEFVRQHGELIRSEPELRAALVVHLLLLYEMNLIDPRIIQRCLLVADGRITSTAEEDERFLATRGSDTSGRTVAAAATAAAPAAGPGAAVGCGRGGRRIGADGVDGDGVDAQPPSANGRRVGNSAAGCGAGADGGSSSSSSSGNDSDGGEDGAGGGGGGGSGDNHDTVDIGVGRTTLNGTTPYAGDDGNGKRPPGERSLPRGQPAPGAERRRRQIVHPEGLSGAAKRRRRDEALSGGNLAANDAVPEDDRTGPMGRRSHHTPGQGKQEAGDDNKGSDGSGNRAGGTGNDSSNDSGCGGVPADPSAAAVATGPAAAQRAEQVDTGSGESGPTRRTDTSDTWKHVAAHKPPDAPAEPAPEPTRTRPTEPSGHASIPADFERGAGSIGSGARAGATDTSGAAAAAAAVEAGAMEAEGGAGSPSSAGGCCAGAPARDPNDGPAQLLTQKQQALQQREQPQEQQQLSQRLPQDAAAKGPVPSRPSPALSWAHAKKPGRGPTPPAPFSQQRSLPSLTRLTGATATAVPAVPGKVAAAAPTVTYDNHL